MPFSVAGMDAYCLLRFHYLCLRICLFGSFWGLVVLTPLYYYGKGDAEEMYVITLANVKAGSDKLVRRDNLSHLEKLLLTPQICDASPSMKEFVVIQKKNSAHGIEHNMYSLYK